MVIRLMIDMTKKKPEYMTKEEYEKVNEQINQQDTNLKLWCLLLTIFTATIFIWASIYLDPQIKKNIEFHSFITSQYNFTEGECIQRQNYGPLVEIQCKEGIKGICITSRCSLYCHTQKVQNRMECKTEEYSGTRMTNVTYSFVFDINYTMNLTKGFLGNQNITEEKFVEMMKKTNVSIAQYLGHCDFTVNENFTPGKDVEYTCRMNFSMTNYNDFELYKYNKTVCTPVYEEKQYGCQSGNDVRIIKGSEELK